MIRAAILAFLMLWQGAAGAAAQMTARPAITVLGPADAIDPEVMNAFTRESGIEVLYEDAATPEVFDKALDNGGIDLLILPAHRAGLLIEAGALHRLDAGQLSFAQGLDPTILQKLAAIDPRHAFVMPYGWSPLGLVYNVAQIKARLGEAAPASWGVILQPGNLRRIADCGVQIMDAPEEVLTAALAFLRLPTEGRRGADLQRAAASIRQIRPQIRRFHPFDHVHALSTGDACMALATHADAMQARARAVEAGNGVEIAFALPREGAPLVFDVLAIPGDSARASEAQRFIAFLMRPDHAARQLERSGFGTAVTAVRAAIDPAEAIDPMLFPDEETMKQLFAVPAHDEANQRLIAREWTRAKTGR